MKRDTDFVFKIFIFFPPMCGFSTWTFWATMFVILFCSPNLTMGGKLFPLQNNINATENWFICSMQRRYDDNVNTCYIIIIFIIHYLWMEWILITHESYMRWDYSSSWHRLYENIQLTMCFNPFNLGSN